MVDILVIDDDIKLLESIRQVLEDGGHKVITTTDSAHALELVAHHRPELLILDILMPHMNGIEICRRLRADPFWGRLPVLFLTAKSFSSDIAQGLEVGGDDYLVKPFNALELLARIKAVLRRMPGGALDANTQVLQIGSLNLSLTHPELTVGETTIPLTPTEYYLMYCLMSRAGHPQSIDQLLSEVWGYAPEMGDPQLVRVHIAHLRSKLGLQSDDPAYIHTLYGRGYLIRSEAKNAPSVRNGSA